MLDSAPFQEPAASRNAQLQLLLLSTHTGPKTLLRVLCFRRLMCKLKINLFWKWHTDDASLSPQVLSQNHEIFLKSGGFYIDYLKALLTKSCTTPFLTLAKRWEANTSKTLNKYTQTPKNTRATLRLLKGWNKSLTNRQKAEFSGSSLSPKMNIQPAAPYPLPSRGQFNWT